MAKHTLTKKSDDISKWYTQVIQQSEMADYSPVKGCMVMRPDSYEIWEAIHQALDPKLKKLGVRNAYFPMFIPMSLIEREADHVEGFAPELAVVTHGGGAELTEKLVVRPTSETIMYEMYHSWIQSHRDLPLCLNQWNNVVRWEKRTYFFLRTLEFLWQEAHTAHATHEEAWQMVLDGLEQYRSVIEDTLAIPVIKGRKSRSETFAGAELTTTVEAMMPDGKALQAGTSHDLGQHFSQASAFNIAFQDAAGQTQYAWQTSFGLSTRILGALILTHGDDEGMVLPPRVAPFQVIVITAQGTPQQTQAAQNLAQQLQSQGIRVMIDRHDHTLGWKLNQAELKGYPMIMILGDQELAQDRVTLKFRHSGEKQLVATADAISKTQTWLDQIQDQMFQKAQAKLQELTSTAETYDDFKKIMSSQRGFIKAFWCEKPECEAAIKEQTKATTRCLPLIDESGAVAEETGSCVYCQQPATHRWLFAQAY